MTNADHYEMPHANADNCEHAGVGKACRPCRNADDVTANEVISGLARELAEHVFSFSDTCKCGFYTGNDSKSVLDHIAEALLPTVRKAQGQALREAADLWGTLEGPEIHGGQRWLRDRAATYREAGE